MSAQTARAPTPQSPILLRESAGHVTVLTLNRPAARNSLSEGLIAELHAALNDIHDDRNVRAVVIAANGPAFSAGHDMKELAARRSDADGGRAYFADVMNACSAMMQAIVRLPKPVVAAVQGVATAAGCQLVASCDLAVTSEAATFATPGVANVAASEAIARSQLATSWQPAAVATPWTAATTGFGNCTIACIMALQAFMICAK